MDLKIVCLVIVNFVNFATVQLVASDENKEEVKGLAERGENKTSPRIVGQISKEKCKEYAKYIWNKETTPLTIPLVKRIGCPFDVTELNAGGTVASSNPGGIMASRKEFPHMVLIGFDSGEGGIKWACGGSLISDQYVLTAAHCLYSQQLGEAKFAKMGFVDHDDEDNVQQFNIVEKIRHPAYKHPFKGYDVALLKLDGKADLNTFVRPACLYNENNTPETKAIASGWSKTGHGGEKSEVLLKAIVNFYDRDYCNKFNRLDSRLKALIDDNLIICAGSPCEGDSGGPLQIYDKVVTNTSCMYDIVGITSSGYPCDLGPDIPTIYTRVSYFVDWIESVVWPPS